MSELKSRYRKLNVKKRKQDAISAAKSARILWVGLHLGIILALVLLPTNLHGWLEAGEVFRPLMFGLLLCANCLTYWRTASSNPGYVDGTYDEWEQEAIDMHRERPLNLLYPSGIEPEVDVEKAELASEDVAKDEPSTGLSAADFEKKEQASINEILLQELLVEDESSQSAGAHSKPLSDNNTRSHISRSETWKGGVEGTDDAFRYGRVCPYCTLWQPIRTKHCHECDKCVRRFDHHCFWIGTCVGQRNHGWFWCYLAIQWVLIMWAMLISNSGFRESNTYDEWLVSNAVAGAIWFILLIFEIFLTCLLGFHTYLAFTNQTTWEVTSRQNITFLQSIPENVLPFSRGVHKNLYEFCFGNLTEKEMLPTREELERRSQMETFWDNRYYSCC